MRILIFAGIFIFFGGIILIVKNYDKLDIQRYGEIVKMRIVDLPRSCIGTKVRYFVTFNYDGEIYDKATRGGFCDNHFVGELIEMKYLEGNKTILWPDESVMTNLFSLGALSLFGLGISISQWRKIRS